MTFAKTRCRGPNQTPGGDLCTRGALALSFICFLLSVFLLTMTEYSRYIERQRVGSQ